MKIFFHAFLLAFSWLITYPAHAELPRDSYYFMLDDGKMSPEEMDEEAMVVHDLCAGHLTQRHYFNCECIAGAFRQIREKDGPMRPQDDIVNSLFRGNTPKGCVNNIEIAGARYEDCLGYVKSFRPRAKDNEAYCACVGRHSARLFSRNPFLSMDYIGKVYGDSLDACTQRDGKGNPLPRVNP